MEKVVHQALICTLLCLTLSTVISSGYEGHKKVNATVDEFLKSRMQAVNDAASKDTIQQPHDIIRIHQPPSSIICNKTNTELLRIFKSAEGSLYLLSSDELLAVDINVKGEPRLNFIGSLMQLDGIVLEFRVEDWQSMKVIVLKFARSLHVHLTSKDFQAKSLEPIQKISLNSPSDRFVLLNNAENLFLVTYGIKNESANELVFYKWKTSFFSQESQELVDLPNQSNLFVFSQNVNEPLILSIGSENTTTRVVVLKLDLATNRWKKQQSLHFKQEHVKNYESNGQLYLIGCSSEAFCAIYKWKQSQFRRHQKVNNKIFESIKKVNGGHGVIIVEKFDRTLSFLTTDNIVEPSLELVIPSDTVDYAVVKSEANKNLYYVEFMMNKTSLTINLYEISFVKTLRDANKPATKVKDVIECIAKLKSRLKNRFPSVQSSHQKTEKLLTQANVLQIESKKVVRARFSNLKDTKIRQVKVALEMEHSAKSLQKQAVDTNIQVELTKRSLKSSTRSPTDERADEAEIEKMDNLIVENLIYSGLEPIFEDLLLKSQTTVIFSDEIKLRNVTANRLTVRSNKINQIQLDQLLNSTSTKHISGFKTIERLKVSEITMTGTLNNLPLKLLESSSSDKPLEPFNELVFQGGINANSLNVKSINGFNVTALVENMFQTNERNLTRGSLIVSKPMNVNSLTTSNIASLAVANLMTIASSQTISADAVISKFHVANLTTNKINDEKLSNNVALINRPNMVKVPTQIMNVHIIKNLNIRDETASDDDQLLSKTIEHLKQHVIGTEASDLSQLYNSQVVIQGSLTIKDATTLSPKTRIFVNDKEVPTNITANYWMRNKKQEIKAERFVVTSQQMKLTNAVTSFLNGQSVKKFVLLNAETVQGTLNVKFESADVKGDVKGHKNNFSSLLYHINQTAVTRQQGPPIFIESGVDFRDKLVCRNLATNLVNKSPVNRLVQAKQRLVVFQATKNAKALDLVQSEVKDALKVETFNNVKLQNYSNTAARIDHPIEISSLRLESFDASNLETEFFEDHQFNEFIENLEKQFQLDQDGTAKAKRNVVIVGNVEFKSNTFVATINEKIKLNDFLSMLALRNEASQSVGGIKTFQSISTRNLKSKLFNAFPVDRLLHQSLSKREMQKISGELFVTNLKAKHLKTKVLNGLTLNQFIDKTKLDHPLKINLNVNEIEVKNLESRSSRHDIIKMIEHVQFPTRKTWKNVLVSDEAEIPLQKDSFLHRIWHLAVVKTGAVQLIVGTVQVNTNRVYFKNLIKTDHLITAQSNPVNIHFLDQDSLKNKTEGSQTISGIKTLLAPSYVSSFKFGPMSYFNSKEINNVNILSLNQSIVRPTSMLRKMKKFSRLQAKDVKVNGRLAGLSPDTIVFVTSNAVQLPELKINQLEVLAMKTFTFYDYSFLHFLQNRMRKSGGSEQEVNGLLTFASLSLLNDTILTSINRVSINDAVFSESDQLQDIQGHKSIAGDIILIGPTTIETINGVDFTDFIEKSVVRNKNQIFEVMEVGSTELKKGMTAKYSISGHRIEELLKSDAHIPKLFDLVSLITKVQNQIKSYESSERVKLSKEKRMLYIDYNPDVSFSFDAPRDNRSCTDSVIEAFGYNNIKVREKRGSEMIVDVPSASITVMPNLQCHQQSVTSKELMVWWTFKDGSNLTNFRNFSLPIEVSNVKILESMSGDVLMVLTLQNSSSLTSEIAVLMLDKTENDWLESQTKITLSNFMSSSALVETSQENFLIVSSFNGTSLSDSDDVLILRFDSQTRSFIENQPRIAGNKFDIILSVNVSPRTQNMKSRTFLMMTRKGSKILFIYRLKDGAKEFLFLRKIPFESEIVEVVILHINNGSPYFIVSLQTGDFCLFEWLGIESWKVKQCGHFSFINQIKSYEYLKKQHLFLTSTLDAGTALTVHRQGENF